MNIGKAAEASGITAKMIRHYEAIGLIPGGRRSPSGYRIYNERDVHTLRFIRSARNLGFSLEQIRLLLSLWHDKARASADVKALAEQHIEELQDKIRELTEMRNVLERLVHSCSGDDRPDCPILLGLEQPQGACEHQANAGPPPHTAARAARKAAR